MRLKPATVIPLVATGGALVVAACGGGSDGGSGSSGASAPTVSEKELRGLPAPLMANVEQANEIIDGGVDALNEKLGDLRGYPVVVNQWAAWCTPCRAEFPIFQQSSEDHLEDVAFLGIDMQDDKGDAEDFLDELPVLYPHIFDQDAAAISSIGGGQVSPTTVFIDERGEVAGVRQGQYTDRSQLEADIEGFLLRG